MEDLIREQLPIMGPSQPEQYQYASRSERQDRSVEDVHEAYRRELVRISKLIHSKPPASVREFARAFQGAGVTWRF